MSSGEAVQLTRQGAMTPDDIATWRQHQANYVDPTPDEEYDLVANSCSTCGVRASLCECPMEEESSSSSEEEGPEDMEREEEEDEEDEEEFMPLDLGWYFDQFDLGPKERIRLCSTYASMLRAQETLAGPAKKRRRMPDKIIDLTKD